MMQALPGLARKVTAAACRLYADETEHSVVVLIHYIKHTHSYDMCCRAVLVPLIVPLTAVSAHFTHAVFKGVSCFRFSDRF